MTTSEVVDSTRDGYVNYIERYIRPALGKTAVRKIDARTLEGFYAELRRRRARCDRKPYIEHKTAEEHDCAKKGCKEHVCKPLAKSTARQIHSIISGHPVGGRPLGLDRLKPGHDRPPPTSQATRAPIPHHPLTPPSSPKPHSSWTTTGAPSSGWS